MKTYTEVRVATYWGDLAELAFRYSKDFFPVRVGGTDVKKYALRKIEDGDKYLIMISKRDL